MQWLVCTSGSLYKGLKSPSFRASAGRSEPGPQRPESPCPHHTACLGGSPGSLSCFPVLSAQQLEWPCVPPLS